MGQRLPILLCQLTNDIQQIGHACLRIILWQPPEFVQMRVNCVKEFVQRTNRSHITQQLIELIDGPGKCIGRLFVRFCRRITWFLIPKIDFMLHRMNAWRECRWKMNEKMRGENGEGTNTYVFSSWLFHSAQRTYPIDRFIYRSAVNASELCGISGRQPKIEKLWNIMVFIAYLIEAVPTTYSTMNVDFRLESPNRLDIEFSMYDDTSDRRRWCEARGWERG